MTVSGQERWVAMGRTDYLEKKHNNFRGDRHVAYPDCDDGVKCTQIPKFIPTHALKMGGFPHV